MVDDRLRRGISLVTVRADSNGPESSHLDTVRTQKRMRRPYRADQGIAAPVTRQLFHHRELIFHTWQTIESPFPRRRLNLHLSRPRAGAEELSDQISRLLVQQTTLTTPQPSVVHAISTRRGLVMRHAPSALELSSTLSAHGNRQDATPASRRSCVRLEPHARPTRTPRRATRRKIANSLREDLSTAPPDLPIVPSLHERTVNFGVHPIDPPRTPTNTSTAVTLASTSPSAGVSTSAPGHRWPEWRAGSPSTECAISRSTRAHTAPAPAGFPPIRPETSAAQSDWPA